jgi:glycosyltransferase involved in cell wall biosynthesis
VLAAIAEGDAEEFVTAPGFVASEQVDDALASALCMLLPSRREGYGLIVVEAASVGTPSIVVAAEDNAATELIEECVNGFIAPRAEPNAIAEAIVRVNEGGMAMRESTARWFADNSARLSLENSLAQVVAVYEGSTKARA